MELTFPVEGPLTSSQTASLLEAGLTYVLYHRGQIPLPYQQLRKSALQQKKFDDEETDTKTNSGFKCHAQDRKLESEAEFDPSCCESAAELKPRDRISAMVIERRKRLLLSRLERQKRQAVVKESKAYNSIQSSLDLLQRLLSAVASKHLEATSSGHSKRILCMALVLGPSLYCPKEVYCFNLPFPWVSDESPLISRVAASKFESTVLRQFYKNMITNADLMDFTCKPLAKTCAHICLVTLGDLNSILHGNNGQFKDIIRLPTLPPSLHQMISLQSLNGVSVETDFSSTLSPQSSLFSHSRKSRTNNKCFTIKIQYQQRSSMNSNEESIEDIVHSRNENNVRKSDSFSGDILFDNNSFSCYQIPLRFKGVQCKNKR